MKTMMSFFAILLACVALGGESVSIKSVEAQQRYPWNGLVDIAVTVEGSEDDIAELQWSFVATNNATGADVPVAAISQNGSDTGSGTTWTRRFIWNATNDVGEVKIDDLALTACAKVTDCVQLWEDGPYWAKCNVGAKKPEEYGYYFWWGDTVGYRRVENRWDAVNGSRLGFSFNMGNCPTAEFDEDQLQYYGYIESSKNLVAKYDMATSCLGTPWRTPTASDLYYLIHKCTMVWTSRNGVYGWQVTGKGDYSLREIFLPVAGYGSGSNLSRVGEFGGYWSSTSACYDYGDSCCKGIAYCLNLFSDDFSRTTMGCDTGLSVRPVRGIATSIGVGRAVTTHLKLDCRTDNSECSVDGEQLCYDIRWYDGAESISIIDNGVVIGSGTVGNLFWQPDSCGCHTLQLKALASDGSEVGSESYEFVVAHVEVITTDAKVATCTENGCTKGSYCSRCQAILSESTTIPAGHQEIVAQPAIDPVGTSPGYTAEIKCSRCGVTLQERSIVWAEGVVIVSSVTAQQRYPWNGLVDIVVTLQGDTNAISQAKCIFVATNCAAQIEVPVTAISQIGADSFENSSCTRRYLWKATNDVGAVKIKDLSLTVAVKSLGGVQLWRDGPYWAECNVGATEPEGYGYYFCWGDTIGYEREGGSWVDDGYYMDVTWVSSSGMRMSTSPFSESTCPTLAKNISSLLSAGYIDSTGNLVAAHDAATMHLGEPWRMPTNAEFTRLLNRCTITWITTNGVRGRLVTGMGAYATKSIFLPAAGGGYDFRLWNVDSVGCYWSSSPDSGSYNAWGVHFGSSYLQRQYNSRNIGRSIRPVREFSGVASIVVTGEGLTTHLNLDCRIGSRVPSAEGETLRYDVNWYENCDELRITDNGVVVTNGTAGVCLWHPNGYPKISCPPSTLKLEVLSKGKVVGSETAQFALDFYSYLSGAAVSTGGSAEWNYLESGNSLASGLFSGKGESWMELVVTNDAKVMFDCKASTLRLNNAAINTFKCVTNGVEVLSLDGNVDWQSVVLEVTSGTVLRWVYSQIATYGTDYENCGWVRNLAVYPKVTVEFHSASEITGKLPDAIVLYEDESLTLPGDADFARMCYSFGGWSDGSRTYAPGEMYAGTNGSVNLYAVWRPNMLASPVIEAQAVYEAESQQISLASTNEGAVLYYSVGGASYRKYIEPFTVTGESVIRAYAMKDNYFNSPTSEVSVARRLYDVVFSAGEFGSIVSGDANQLIRYGDGVSTVAVEADKWHTFIGWSGATNRIVSATNFVAQYAPKTFTLKFGDAEFDWTYGDALTGPTPTLAKHRLVGWIYQGTNYVVGSVLPFDGEDMSYTAVWEEKHLSAPVITLPEYYDGESCTATVTAQDGVSIRCKVGDGDWFEYAAPFAVIGSTTVTAYAAQDDWYDSDCVTKATVRGPWTFGEYLGASNVVFTSNDAGAWRRTNEVNGVAGYYLACGPLDANETGSLSATFHGKGTIIFRFRASVESWTGVMDFDRFRFYDNGVALRSWSGETGWQEVSIELTNGLEHAVSWSYEKDDGNTFEANFDNCVWLDWVEWKFDPIPDLGENPTTEEITNVFVEAKAEDPKLAEKITTEAAYTNFSAWAKKVQPHGGGDAVGAAGVMAAPNAWVSYALGSEMLLEAAPTDADLTVEAFEPKSGEDGKFDFTVSVKDVEVGGAATTEAQMEQVKENLKQVFGLEGGTTLEPGGMSSANVDITFGTPADGKVKFTAGPKDTDAKTFFMKVRVK